MDDGRRGSVSRRVGEGRNEASREEGSLMNGGLYQAVYSISWSDKEPFPFSHWGLASPHCLPLYRERA